MDLRGLVTARVAYVVGVAAVGQPAVGAATDVAPRQMAGGDGRAVASGSSTPRAARPASVPTTRLHSNCCPSGDSVKPPCASTLATKRRMGTSGGSCPLACAASSVGCTGAVPQPVRASAATARQTSAIGRLARVTGFMVSSWRRFCGGRRCADTFFAAVRR